MANERGGTWSDIRSLGVFGRAWSLGILLFSLARALIAWPTLGRYGVDPWLFLAIDIVTALPYGLGQAITVKILRDRERSPRDAAFWAIVVAVSFLAPYIYIFIASGSMPLLAYLGVLAWMIVFGTLAVIRIRRQVHATGTELVPPHGTGSDEKSSTTTTDHAELPDSRRTS